MRKKQSFLQWCISSNHQDLLQEWDIEKNKLHNWFPEEISCTSRKFKVWWLCNKGHSYDAYVVNKVRRGDGCPYCTNHRLLQGYNDLQHVAPRIIDEWDYVKNKEMHDIDIKHCSKKPHPMLPTEILYGSSQKVFWKCNQGHETFLSPNNRHVRLDGTFSICNICANEARSKGRRKTRSEKNNLADTLPEAIEEWVSSEHQLTPAEVSCASTETVHWKCKRGHEFVARVVDRVHKKEGKYYLCHCEKCWKHQRTSIVEQICYFYVKKAFRDTINTYKIDGFEFDIFIPSRRLAIEYDGSYTHRHRQKRENEKDIYAQENGIQLYRFRPKELNDTISSIRITVKPGFQGVIDGLFVFFNLVGVDPPNIDIDKDYSEIMQVFEERAGKSIIHTSYINEWDYEKNEIDPRYIMSTESHIKVYWKCPNGHPSYLSYPYNRTVRHTKCPLCSIQRTNQTRKKSVRNIDTGEVFASASEADSQYGKSKNTYVSRCCRGRSKTAYGFHWEFVSEEGVI